MRASFTLKLTICLAGVPCVNIQTSNVQVQGFGNDRAGGNGPVGSVRMFVFIMALEEDASIDLVDF